MIVIQAYIQIGEFMVYCLCVHVGVLSPRGSISHALPTPPSSEEPESENGTDERVLFMRSKNIKASIPTCICTCIISIIHVRD